MFDLVSLKPKILRFIPKPRFWLKPGYRQAVLILVLGLGLTALLALGQPALATLAGTIRAMFAWILEAISALLGQILLWEISFLISISGYNDFLNARVVTIGWSLVRDVANMFYILVMLIIAFGTMFKLEQYSWKKLLPRLILTAILVNFSKTIVGLFIDFAQVIMLTFVNGYSAAAGGNFISMTNIKQLFESTKNVTDPNLPDLSFSILLGYLLGTVMLGVSVIVIGVFVLILLCRILTLWVLIVLAPMAFMLGTFPKGQEYYADWWKRLTNNIIVGPVLAFFLWLSLAALGGGDNQSQVGYSSAVTGEKEVYAATSRPQLDTGTTAGDWDSLASFAVSIAMLFVALQMTQQLGVTGAGLASGAAGWMKKTGTDFAKRHKWWLLGGAAAGGLLPGVAGGAVAPLLKLAGIKGLAKYGRDKTEQQAMKVGEWGLKGVSYIPGLGTFARGKAAELKAKRLEAARKAEAKVSEYTPEQVIKSSKQKALTVESQQEKFSSIARILSEPELRKKVKPGDLSAMVSDFKTLGDKLGRGEKTSSLLKTFYKENPHLVTDAQGQTNTPERKAEVKKTLEGQSLQNVLDMDADAFANDDVFNQFDHARWGPQIMERGSEKLRKGYSKAMMQKRFNLADDEVNNPGSHSANIQTKVGDRLPEVPDGALPPEIFRALNNDQQVDSLKLKKITVDRLEAADLTNNNGRLAGAIANSDSPELIQSSIISKRADMETGLRDFDAAVPLAGASIDPANPAVAARAAEIKQQRLSGVIPFGFVDKMLNNNGIAPHTAGADAFMDNWDRKQAVGELEKERVGEQKARARSVLTGMQGSPARIYGELGYDAAADNWNGATPARKQEQQAMTAKMASTDEIASVLKNLKVEAVVKKDAAGNITGLTQLGNVLTQNMRVSTLMKFAQEHQTAALRGLSAALIAGKHLRGSAVEKKQIEDRKKAPAFNQIDWEDMVSKLKDKITE